MLLQGLSLAAVGESGCMWNRATLRCSVRPSHCRGLSCCGVPALGMRASVVVMRGLGHCDAQVQLLCGIWGLPGTVIKPTSPALIDGFLAS